MLLRVVHDNNHNHNNLIEVVDGLEKQIMIKHEFWVEEEKKIINNTAHVLFGTGAGLLCLGDFDRNFWRSWKFVSLTI